MVVIVARFNVMKNGSIGGTEVNVVLGITGLFEDITGSESLVKTDEVTLRCRTFGSAGTIVYAHINTLLEVATDPAIVHIKGNATVLGGTIL